MSNDIKTATAITILSNQAQDILGQLVDSGGEITPEIETHLAHLSMSLPTQVDAAAFLIDWLKSQREFFKQQADSFLKIARSFDKVEERVKEGVKLTMTEMGVYDLHGSSMRFKLSEIEPRLEYDEKSLSEEYLKQVVTTKVDDTKLRIELASGKVIVGAALVPNYRLAKYVNRKKEEKAGA